MASRFTLDEVASQVLGDGFDVSGDEESDYEGEGIQSYRPEASYDDFQDSDFEESAEEEEDSDGEGAERPMPRRPSFMVGEDTLDPGTSKPTILASPYKL